MAYGGSFGTGLLLREPPLASGSVAFRSTVNARGALYAKLASAVGEGPLHVFGAHLSPGGPEQVPQVEQLLSFIHDTAGNEPALLLGDLNLVPGSALFGRIARAGFDEGQAHEGRNTYNSQALLGGTFAGPGWRLDHVLLRGINAALRTQRILDEPVRLNVAGREVLSMLSDHAGLLSRITASGQPIQVRWHSSC
jgi:endonuclease/exonuclease/phosphatase family metal-dependent hydrolase